MKYSDISDWNYILSTVGNALFSGLTFEQFWDCVTQAKNREELDAAVSASIRMKELISGQEK